MESGIHHLILPLILALLPGSHPAALADENTGPVTTGLLLLGNHDTDTRDLLTRHAGQAPRLSLRVTGTVNGMDNARRGPSGTLVISDPVSGAGYIHAGHVVFEGIVSPGNSPGCISIGGNATFSITATLVMEIAGTIPCSEHDRLSVAGSLSVNGATLQLVLLNGFQPQPGQRFDLLDWGSFAGGFGYIDWAAAPLPAYLEWDVSQLESSGEVVIKLLADGDLNGDGQLTAADVLLAYRALTGQVSLTPTQLLHGDVAPLVNGLPVPDGNFNLGDVLIIQRMAIAG